jgi:hypothetical protein
MKLIEENKLERLQDTGIGKYFWVNFLKRNNRKFYQTKKHPYTRWNNQWSEQATNRMGENIWRLFISQEVNTQTM